MSTPKQVIIEFLDKIRSEGRPSPAGMVWNDFYNYLMQSRTIGKAKPPLPLILAASGESAASKHNRLKLQLEWAEDNNCLLDALQYLNSLPEENWESYATDKWNQSSY